LNGLFAFKKFAAELYVSASDLLVISERKDYSRYTGFGNGFGDDVIISGEGEDQNRGDVRNGEGSGEDIIVSGSRDDSNGGNEGSDIFVCGG